jgi:hypothetical protein
MFGMTKKRPLGGLRQGSKGAAPLKALGSVTGKKSMLVASAAGPCEWSRFRHWYGTDARELRR